MMASRKPIAAIAGFGILLAMVGADPQTAIPRWTMGELYLFDGLELVPITLGLFALPELADMAIARRSVAGYASIEQYAPFFEARGFGDEAARVRAHCEAGNRDRAAAEGSESMARALTVSPH